MAVVKQFLEKEIPYGKLANIGIDKDKVLSMPKDLLDTFMSGSITPLIQAQVRSKSGTIYEVPIKLQIVQNNKGDIELLTYPVRRNIPRENTLSEIEREHLQKGGVIRKEVNEEGIRRMQFIQLDNETKSLIKWSLNGKHLSERIAQMEKINDIQLGINQKNAIKEGKAIELDVGHEKVSVGVDLKEPLGFKIVKGDLFEWERQQKIKYDIANDGFMGYVLTDQNRWEYEQFVNKLQHKEQNQNVKEERKTIKGIKL